MDIIPYSQLSNALNKYVADGQKKIRLAMYKTLGDLGKLSRQEIIKTYPKKFPDENGIRKNKGIPKLVVYDNKVDKSIPNSPSIRIYAKDEISFMEKQEFGGELNGGTYGRNAAVPFTDSLKKMRSGTKGMKDKYTIKEVYQAARKAIKPSLKHGSIKRGHRPPQPFFMETKSMHTMVAIREGRNRLPVMPLYHFDRKRRFRPRWDFFETVEGVVVSMADQLWGEELKKAFDKK